MTGRLTGIDSTFAAHRAQCEAVLKQLGQLGQSEGNQVLQRLRKRCGPELSRIVSVAAGLQGQARAKLASPNTQSEVWWVSSQSLQQATPWQVARTKASWFGDAHVHDLCCGIGGDSIQLAARGELTAVDLDPMTAAMAGANLDLAGYPETRARAVRADATCLPLTKSDAIHIDPDRRPRQQRRSNPNDFQPAWIDVSRLVASSEAAVIKLAPASQIPETGLPAVEFHRCWIALSGSVREQALLWGSVIDRTGQMRGERSALVMRSDGSFNWFAPDKESRSAAPPDCESPPSVLVDPNAAVRASGLTEAFANQFGLRLLNGPVGFLAGDFDFSQVDNTIGSLAVIGAVQWWGTCDDRKLRKEFRARGVYPETIKVRGTDHDPAVLSKRYRQCGDRPVTLWIGRHGARVFAAMTE